MARKIKKLKSHKDEFEGKKTELLKNIVTSIAGDSSVKIIEILYGKQNVNEFDIAKKLNLTINQTRNILYKLSDEGIVGFTRKKDKKSGGWYIYFWTLDLGKSFIALKNKLSKGINNLETSLLTKKSKQFYYCANCGIEISEEDALSHNFTCPECGEVFQLRDNAQIVNALVSQISKLKSTLSDVENELGQINKKEGAVNIRKMKAEARKKKIEREIRRVERVREKKKEEKSMSKKQKMKKAGKKKIVSKKIKKKILKTKRKKDIRKKKRR